MTKQVYKFDETLSEFEGLDNGSTTDTLQWCELHCGHCHDVVPVRRHFENPNRQDEIFLACQSCVRDLKKADLFRDSKFARHECSEVVVPKGLSKGRKVAYSMRRTRQQQRPSNQKADRSLLRSRQQSYEVTLDALQVKYLRALGLLVIPA